MEQPIPTCSKSETWQKVHLAAPGTPDGAPVQTGRVGKVDAWTGYLEEYRNIAWAHAERIKGKLQWSWNPWDGKGNEKGL